MKIFKYLSITFLFTCILAYSSAQDGTPASILPSSNQLSFLSDYELEEYYNLYSVDLSTGEIAMIRHFIRDEYFGSSYSWSPDGESIIFSQYPEDADECCDAEIFKFDIHTREEYVILNREGDDYFPVWSPDGTRIAFLGYTGLGIGNQVDIFVMDSNGDNLEQLTSVGSLNFNQPTWSPDGSQIAFGLRNEGQDDIAVVNSDGTNQHFLFETPSNEFYPAWSPLGTQIAFMSDRNADESDTVMLWAIFSFDLDTEETQQLTDIPSFLPSWSPDGSQIAFSRYDWAIYVANADGSEARFVLSEGHSSRAQWIP